MGLCSYITWSVRHSLGWLVFSLKHLRRIISDWVVHRLIAFGLLLYAVTGIDSLFLGSNFLDYNPLGSTAIKGQHWGIIAIELGVGITVFAVMLAIYYAFAGRPPSLDDREW